MADAVRVAGLVGEVWRSASGRSAVTIEDGQPVAYGRAGRLWYVLRDDHAVSVLGAWGLALQDVVEAARVVDRRRIEHDRDAAAETALHDALARLDHVDEAPHG